MATEQQIKKLTRQVEQYERDIGLHSGTLDFGGGVTMPSGKEYEQKRFRTLVRAINAGVEVDPKLHDVVFPPDVRPFKMIEDGPSQPPF